MDRSQQMRILMTADTVGGVWTYAIDLAREICGRGNEIHLAAMGESVSEEQRAEAREIDGLQLYEKTGKLEWMQDPWADVKEAGEWLLDLARRISPDLVHLNDYAHGQLDWPAPVVVVGHSCVLSWFEAVRGGSPPPEWERYAREVRAGLQGAECVIAPTQAMLESLHRHYGPFPRVEAILNGRDDGAFGPAEKEPVVFCAGRLWDEAKNLSTLADAADEIEWPVYVAGQTRHPEGGEEIPAGVEVLGYLRSEQIARQYSRASIYALPARYEPFGLTALEAALSGCALVLGDIPTLREVWGDTATYVAVDDSDEVAATINELIADDGLRQQRAEQAMVRARELSAARMANQYIEVYGSLQ